MGKKAVDIANLDVEKLILMLNEALSEEWLAYYLNSTSFYENH